MPSRSSSGSSKGRGRPSRRARGGNFEDRRSSDKSSNKSDKKSNEGASYPKRTNRSTRSSRFEDSGERRDKKKDEGRPYPNRTNRPNRSDRYSNSRDKNDRRSKEGTPYSKNTNRPNRSDRNKDSGDKTEKRNDERRANPRHTNHQNRPSRFNDGGHSPKKNWRKSSEDSGYNPELKTRKNDRNESFGSEKRTYSGGKDRFPKFDKGHFRKRTGESRDSGKKSHAEEPAPTGKIRLNKFIANSGVCSRREADELITLGLISVNGVTITELGYKVDPNDEVRHEGKLLRREKPVYILMNKPKGFLTTTSDPEDRNTVMHLISNFVKERVYPVGRLDRNTTGLLLLTNDGDLAEKLMHPSYNVKKIYKVELDRPLTKGDAQRIVDGVRLEEGIAMVDDLAIVSEDRKTVGLEIHIGWNRVVRRIFEALEYNVVKLDRSVYAGLTKKDLGRGEWRFLKKEELVILKHLQ
jgi:23S rRNA pseudouridine2605 synthase